MMIYSARWRGILLESKPDKPHRVEGQRGALMVEATRSPLTRAWVAHICLYWPRGSATPGESFLTKPLWATAVADDLGEALDTAWDRFMGMRRHLMAALAEADGEVQATATGERAFGCAETLKQREKRK